MLGQTLLCALILLLSFPSRVRSSSARLDNALHLQLNISTTIGTVDPRYVAYTLDWWPATGGCPPNGWGTHSNALQVDLNSPKLKLLVSALGPSIFRIGGTRDKVVQYQIPGTSCKSTNNASAPCLNATRWDQLHEFARTVNAQIVFGLSYPMTQTYGEWNESQATALMLYSQAQNYTRQTTLYGFELGEELTRFRLHRKEFGRYVKAYHRCADLLRSIYPSSNTKPLLMGPCPGMNWPSLNDWFPAFLKGTRGALEVASYHSYNQIAPNKLYLNFTIPGPTGRLSNVTHKMLGPGDTGWQAVAMKQFVDGVQEPSLQLWLGEMGPHNGCGGPGNISATLASSFAYLDSLGSLARLGHAVLARQTLVGGKYELLQCTLTSPQCDFEPQPDYWLALLWRRLMGSRVLEAPRVAKGKTAASEEALRFHAHCTEGQSDGSITITFSNLSPNRSFEVSTGGPLGDDRVEYVLQGYKDGLNSNQVELNGSLLHVGSASQLPKLEGRRVSNHNNPLVLQPSTLGFVVFPNANAKACQQQQQPTRITTAEG